MRIRIYRSRFLSCRFLECFPRVTSIPMAGSSLFNGKDLQGWHLLNREGPNLWKVEEGSLYHRG